MTLCLFFTFNSTLSSAFIEQEEIENIIFIVIDTLRADHLQSYGYLRTTSPFIDTLADKGILFRNVFSQSATTVPSHASLFTSLYPAQINVLKNGHVLDQHFITLAELLRSHGFETAAFVSTNTHFKAANLDQGFGYFNEPDTDTRIEPYRTADKTTTNAIKWIKNRNSQKNLFLWLHFYDTHSPYTPPAIHRIFNTDERFLKFLKDTHKADFRFFSKLGLQNRFICNIIDSYDGEIRFVDTELHRFFDFFNNFQLKKKTLWIITSDHGEGLGNHRWIGHSKNIYNEQLHIPLIFFFSSVEHDNKEFDDIVELTDIFPTIMDITRIDPSNISSQEIQGTSLMPLLNNIAKKNPRTDAFSQREIYDTLNTENNSINELKIHFKLSKKPSEQMLHAIKKSFINYEKGDAFSIQNKKFKYVYKTGCKDEFYNIANDPYETANLINRFCIDKILLRYKLKKMIQVLNKNMLAEPRSVDPVTKEKLKSLGYAQ
ncbi:sulfatase [Elusimicrobiota bacterium]